MTFDATRPSIARVYDYLIGGSGSSPADRQMAEAMMDPQGGYPGVRRLARDNRAFVTRAVTWAAAGGIRQFLDCGCGLPRRPLVHETARAGGAAASVAYVDYDPEAAASTAAAAAGTGLAVLKADVRDPGAILAARAVRAVIDTGEPVCVILAAVLHYMSEDEAREAVAGFMAPLPAGSCAVISTVRYDPEGLAGAMTGRYTAGRLRNFTPAAVTAFFAAADLTLTTGRVADIRSWPMLPSGVTRDAKMIGGAGVRR